MLFANQLFLLTHLCIWMYKFHLNCKYINFIWILFQRTVIKPLPPLLQKNQKTKDFYLTTNAFTHDYKSIDPTLHHDLYKKAPGHWNVKYTEDTINKVSFSINSSYHDVICRYLFIFCIYVTFSRKTVQRLSAIKMITTSP